MNTDPNDALKDNANINGGDLEPEEARLFAEGVDEPAEGATTTDTAADKVTQGTPEADEAARLQAVADADAAALETQRLADEAAAAAAKPAAVKVELPAKPEAPMDFTAERARVNSLYTDEGSLDAIGLADERERITLAEIDYKQALREWERVQAEAVDRQNAAIKSDWDSAALAFEAANKEFLANPLRHKVMQDAINTVLASGEALNDAQVLDKALAIAVDYTGYAKPAPAVEDPNKQREAVGDALKQRKPAPATQTLADAPASANERISGTEGFASLDALAIPDLEIAYANMTPAQQEAYLREAPGATANGRD